MDAFFQFFAPADRFDQFVRIFSAIFGQMLIRYLVFAGLAFAVFYVWFRQRLAHRKIQHAYPGRDDYRREVLFSVITTLVFALFGYAIFCPWILPHTRIYFRIGDYGVPYLIASVAAMVIIHDAYFYWTHRLMHTRLLYRTFHAVHHRSTNPSPWAAFSFHPLEAIVEAGIILVIVFLIPSHPVALLLFLVWMTVFNVLGHVGFEFIPRWITRNPVGRLLNTPTSHNLHHRNFRSNFTLYFRFWDILCRTTDRDYEKTLDAVQSPSHPAA